MHTSIRASALALIVIVTTSWTSVAGAQPATAPAQPTTAPARPRLAPVHIGPPAPVPPAVAIPRPSSDELTQINDALRHFIDGDASPAAPLLKKYQSIIMVQPPRLNTAATYTQTGQRQGPRHEQFVARAKQGDIELL